MALIAWDEITNSDKWASLTPSEQGLVYNRYLSKIGKEEAWQGLSTDHKRSVIENMQSYADFNKPTPESPTWGDILKTPFKNIADVFKTKTLSMRKKAEATQGEMMSDMDMNLMDMMNYDVINPPKENKPSGAGRYFGPPMIKTAPKDTFLNKIFSKGMSNTDIQKARLEIEAEKVNLNIEDYKDAINPQDKKMRRFQEFNDRMIKSFGAGALSTAEGLMHTADWLIDSELTRELSNSVKLKVQDLTPEDQTLLEEFVGAGGSMATFFIPGFGVAKATELMWAVPTLARWTGAGVMTALEAFTEAGQIYDRVLEKTENKEIAGKKAGQGFMLNSVLLMVTNKIGLFGETGRAWRRRAMSGIMEGSQEWGQADIQALTTGDPIQLTDQIKAAAFGAILGTGASFAMDRKGKGAPAPGENLEDIQFTEEERIATDVKPSAIFRGWQETANGGFIALYNVEGGRLHHSTVTASTLSAEGIEIPEPKDLPKPEMKVGEPGAPNNILVDHYTHVEDIDVLKPEKAGTGKAGREKGREQINKVHFYGRGVPPEDIFHGAKKMRVVLDGNKIYDSIEDPKGIWASTEDPYTREKKIKNAGYDGFKTISHGREVIGYFKDVPAVEMKPYNVGVAPRAGSNKTKVEQRLRELLTSDYTDVVEYKKDSKGVYKGEGEDSPTLNIESGDIESVKKVLTGFGQQEGQESILISQKINMPYSNPPNATKDSYGIPAHQGFSLEIDYSDTVADVKKQIDGVLASNGVDGYHHDVKGKKILVHHIPEWSDQSPKEWSKSAEKIAIELTNIFPEMHYDIQWYNHDIIYPGEEGTRLETEQIEKEKFPENKTEIIGRSQGIQLRRVGEMRGAGMKVEDAVDVASLLAPTRKYAHEHVWALMTDEDGSILDLINMSIGLPAQAPFSPILMAGRALNTPGCKKIYSVHNHPSGSAHMSSEDGKAHEALTNNLKDHLIIVESIVLGREGFMAQNVDNVRTEVIPYKPVVRKIGVPIRKKFIQTLDKTRYPIAHSVIPTAKILTDLKAESGFLFLSPDLSVAGFVPFPKIQPNRYTNMVRIKKMLLQASEKLNASQGVLALSSKADLYQNVIPMVQRNLRGLQILDTICKTEQGGHISVTIEDLAGYNPEIMLVEDHQIMPYTAKGGWGNSFVKTHKGIVYEGKQFTPHAAIMKKFNLKPQDIKDSGFITKDGRYLERSFGDPEKHAAFQKHWAKELAQMREEGVSETIQGYQYLSESDQKKLDNIRSDIASGALEVDSFAYFDPLDKFGRMIKGHTIRHTSRFPVGFGGTIYGPRQKGDKDVKYTTEEGISATRIEDALGRIITDTPILSQDRETRIKEMVDLINANKEAADWYTDWYRYMDQFRDQGMSEEMVQRHLQIMAVLSPNQSIVRNVGLYKKTIDSLENDQPLEGVSPHQRTKVEGIWDGSVSAVDMGIRDTKNLFGKKVGAFIRASLDHPSNAIVVDRWVGRLFGYDFGWSPTSGQNRFVIAKHVYSEIVNDIQEAAKQVGLSGSQAQAALWVAANPNPATYESVLEGDPVEYMPKGMLTMHRVMRSNLTPWTERGTQGNVFVETEDGTIYEGNDNMLHVVLMEHFGLKPEEIADSGFVDDEGKLIYRIKGRVKENREGLKADYLRAWSMEAAELRRGVYEPAPKYQTVDPEIQKRIDNAAQASRPISFLGKITDGFRTLGHKITRVYEELPRTREFARLQFDLLKLSKQKPFLAGKATEKIKKMIKGLSKKEITVFERKVLYDDLWETASEGKPLPFGFTPESLKSEMDNLDTQMTSKVKAAILERDKIWGTLRQAYIAAMSEVGMDVSDRVARAHYFRHQVVDYIEAKGLFGTGKRLTTPAYRGFLKKRLGSAKDINPNFIGPETEVMSQMMYDIQIAKVIKSVDQNYNKAKDFRVKIKELQEEDPDVTIQDLLKGSGYVNWQPLPGNTFYLANAIPAELAQAMSQDFFGQALDPNLVRQVLAVGGKRKQFIIKEEIATTLDNLQLPESSNIIAQGHRRILVGWKIWQLISPKRFAKYNIRNLTGDADGVFCGNPASFLYVPRAVKDIWEGMIRGQEKNQDFQDWMERGGMASTLQAQEMDDLNALKHATHLFGAGMNPWKIYWKAARLSTDARESVLRYATYLSYLEQMKEGNGIPKNFGASKREEILGLDNIQDKAFWLSNDLLGAYDRVGLMGQSLRAHLIPFWSWKEANAKRYFRLFMNAAQDKNLSGAVGRKLLGTVAHTPFMAYRVGKFAIRATAFWAFLQVWNNLKYPDEEKNLPTHIRTRPHIILGVDSETGETNHFSRLGALPDLLEWVGLDGAIDYVNQFCTGKMTLKDIAKDMAKQPVNIIVQGGEPFIKISGELITRRSLFPDVFRPGTVRDRLLHVCQGLGLGNEYKLVSKLPSRPYKESIKGLYMYSSDPLQSGYYEFLRAKSDFLKSINKGAEGYWITPKGNALYYARLALRYRDKTAATAYMKEYIDKGGKIEGIVASLKRLDPLAGLSKIEKIVFLKKMTPEDKRNLVLAHKYYFELVSGVE